MSKAIKWQIPFASLSGTLYRLDIYAEGYTGDPIQLMAGDNPFTTDEDNSENFFTPVRSQTGNINVCTRKPDGTMLTLDEILPANNIDHPVRLINISNSNAIEWQGFLSCESYSQNYTAIPENLTLSVISVLEAMGSVEEELEENMAFKTVIGHVAYAMKSIETQSGMQLFRNIYISDYCLSAMVSNYFYNNIYFNTDELVSGDNITIDVHSDSCSEIIEKIAKFFGGCWREVGQDIYLEVVGKDSQFNYQSFANIADAYIDGNDTLTWNTVTITTQNIESFSWRGDNHQRSAYQGMRRVKVSAKLNDFDCKMSLEECPFNSLVENPSSRQSQWGEVHVNTNETFYSLAEHKHILAKAVFPTDLSGAHLDFVQFLSGINYSNTIFWTNNLFRTEYYRLVNTQTGAQSQGISQYLTSFMMYLRDANDGELKSCLAICGNPRDLWWTASPPQGRKWTKFALTDSNYLFKQTTPLVFSASSGYMRIYIETLAWLGINNINPSYVSTNTNYGGPAITIAVKFGSKWLYKDGDTYTWSDDFHTVNYQFDHGSETKFGKFKPVNNWSSNMPISETDGLLVEIPEFMTGFVSVMIYHEINAITDQPQASGLFDVVIDKLDLEYIPIPTELRTDRSENIYAVETGQNFREELSVDCALASDANNTKLATMLWSDSTTPVKLINLGGINVRPEADLLQRLKEYYSAARQKLELKIAHPTAAALPIVKLNGIDDLKIYLPLSESRDWQQEISTLTCLETPQE